MTQHFDPTLKMKNLFFPLVFFATHIAWGQVQCAVDVSINQGASIEMCENAPQSISASNGFNAYAWSGPESSVGQTITPQFSGNYVVAATDAVGCISTDTIAVIIHPAPTPSIVSSEGNPICSSSGGTNLSLTNTYSSYDWGGGNTGPTYFVSTAGAYAVTVEDNNGCTGHAVITLTEVTFDLTVTSTSGCASSSTLLQASGGNSYLWSTGETGSSIVVNPASITNYSVTITNGGCTDVLSTSIAPLNQENFDLGDTLYLGSGDVHILTGPDGYQSYQWSPSTYLSDSTGQLVTFTAGESSTIVMQAEHESGCIFSDTLVILVVDLSIPNGFSPNGDSYNEFFVVPELYQMDGEITVWNRWGDIVFESKHYENNWNGTCETSFCAGNGPLPEGTYFYQIVVQNIQFDGYITLKR